MAVLVLDFALSFEGPDSSFTGSVGASRDELCSVLDAGFRDLTDRCALGADLRRGVAGGTGGMRALCCASAVLMDLFRSLAPPWG